MCKALKIERSVYYHKSNPQEKDAACENAVIHYFYLSRCIYGTRKLKKQLSVVQNNHVAMSVSRRKIGQIMKKYKLISKYTLKHSKWQASKVNRDAFQNLVDRDFADRKPLEVVVSDLTYVKCAGKWHYICLLLDLNNRKIIGSAVGKRKDAKLVRTAFYGVQADLRRIEIFHADTGREFKNQIMDEMISAFGIDQSLSAKGSLFDVAGIIGLS